MFSIEYKITGAGWATVKISNNEKTVTMDVSYLYDSLKELTQSAIDIKTKQMRKVLFMEEPGEFLLLLNRSDTNIIDYELRWYEDWNEWNLVDEDNFKLVLKGETTIAKYINQVRNVLKGILNELTPEEYKEKWINHEFPMEECKLLG
ncbi:hypothetical protein [Jejuia spongiicola]|uniref:Uncharacterized protein n=1 Tax=Jejuia spongiicola TaxID=2942207 RepID=A0ABT0Q977_9FLAO|nr:hypothetical protein [Jejuia spongiicola]MCL6293532.1 hypothetical protein [Jejuia spongiicola]